MQNTSNSHFHGYVNSSLDNAIRVRLTNGQIVALKINQTGTEAQLLGEKIRLPDELHQLSNVSHLVTFLKSHRLGLMGQEIIIEGQTNRASFQEIKTSPPITFEDV